MMRVALFRGLLLPLIFLPGCATGRASAAELDRIVEALRLEPGMRVADVGAGNGEWSEALAEKVGPQGHVFATEVDEDDLEEIRGRLEAGGFDNFTVILGDQDGTGLPADCCDAILLRLVYHHFTDPPLMLESLRAALRDGAPLVAIEITPQRHWDPIDGVPERDGHGISADDLIEEMTLDGFEVVRRLEDWDGEDPDHYCVIFRAKENRPVSSHGPESSRASR